MVKRQKRLMQAVKRSRAGRTASPRSASDVSEGTVATEAAPDPDGSVEAAWLASRSGAIAGRGYHHQDLVGAWLATRALAGEVAVDRVIPEGWEDLTCEGAVDAQVQVKSRQARVGDFRYGEAARHVLDAAERRRARDGDPERLVLVFERPVEGHAPAEWTASLVSEPTLAGLVTAVRTTAARRGWTTDDVDALLDLTTVVVLPRQVLLAEAAARVAARTGLPLGATLPVIQALRWAIAEHADRNAEVAWSDRSGLTRTDLDRIVTDTAALIDRQSLEEAVASGSCEPIDFDTPLADGDFYAGTGVQPGHVVAGLVVARPEQTDAVLAGLEARRAVLVAGPSGIGKSAVVWMAAYVARHVIWYRVNRLGESDVEPLIRLARAAGAGRYGLVGFVIDGVGVGGLTAWDALYRRVAATPGIVLLGSVREEDVLPLETFGEAVVVRPRLDEDLAARIHAELLSRAATAREHWREAFEDAGGLTLEFTHLLTRGRRLHDVVSDQVQARIRDGRAVELAVLAPVSVADQWGAALSVDAVSAVVGAPQSDLKAALARLVDEHLVTVDRGVVRGLHPLRSEAIASAVHRVPPPQLADTVQQTLRVVAADQLRSYVGRAVGDRPDLGQAVLDALSDRLAVPHGDDADVVTAALDGLRLADFAATAREWAQVLDRHDVPVPLRPLALDLAMIDGELVDAFEPHLLAAVEEIRAGRDDACSPLRDELISRLGVDRVRDLLLAAPTTQAAAELLSPLALTGLDLTSAELQESAPLAAALGTATLDELGAVISAAASVSASTGAGLVTLAGGQAAILDKLMAANPWLLDLAVVQHGGESVLRGRFVHPSDRLNPDPGTNVVDLAKVGLQCLPDVSRADLTTVWTGGIPMQIGDFEIGRSGLLRRYAPGPAEIAWNRTRSQLAHSFVASDSATTRLSGGLRVLERTADFLADLADTWAASRGHGRELERLNETRELLLADLATLAPPPIQAGDDSASGAQATMGSDAIHGVVQGIAHNLAGRLDDASGYASLAAFTGDTIRRQLAKLPDEPWGLLGMDRPPAVIGRLDTLLGDLTAVLAELALGDTTPRQIAGVTSGAPRGAALARAAKLARTRANRRYNARTTALTHAASDRGLRIEIKTREDPTANAVEWPPRQTAIVVNLASLADCDQAFLTIAELLDEAGLPDKAATVIPAREGTPLPKYAARVFANGKVFPTPDVATEWLDVLPGLRQLPLTDAALDAHAALQEVSALAYLDQHRGAGTRGQAAADEAVARFRTAIARIEALPEDEVTTTIRDLLIALGERVQGELDGTATMMPLTEAVTRGVAGNLNSDFTTMTGMALIATEWDIDPATAAALLRDA